MISVPKTIVTEEIVKRINPRNLRIVNLYIKKLQEKNISNSIVKRKSDFLIFLCWNALYNDNLLLPTFRKTQVNNFLLWGQRECNWSESRIKSMRSLLKTLFDFIVDFLDDEYPNFHNPIERIKSKQ